MPYLGEADTCRKFVVPLLQKAGWDNEPHSIAEQRTITDGRIIPVGKGFMRKPPKRVDYLLRYTRDFPLAVVEAKAAYKAAADGVQQAKAYAEMLGVKFAYATNGHGTIEIDYAGGRGTGLRQAQAGPQAQAGRANGRSGRGGQHQRPGQHDHEDAPRLGTGLQRPGGRDGRADHPGRRRDHRGERRPPAHRHARCGAGQRRGGDRRGCRARRRGGGRRLLVGSERRQRDRRVCAVHRHPEGPQAAG